MQLNLNIDVKFTTMQARSSCLTSYGNGRHCGIDGSLEDGSFGRLVNDEHKAPNCRMKLIEAEGKPHICLFALKEITAGTGITYDYGGKDWPWRKEIPSPVTSTAAQESIKDRFPDQTMSSTVSTEDTAQWCKHPF